MPRNDEEVRETFAWGVLWTIGLLVAILVAAGYFFWYKPASVHLKGNNVRSVVSNPLDGARERPSLPPEVRAISAIP